MENIQKKKSPTGKMFIFGFPRIGASLVLGIQGFALYYLYTSGYGVSSFLAGLAMAMGYVSIAFSQFFIGWLSDTKYTKWGRRKPYVVILSPIFAISFILLLMPALFLHNPTKNQLFWWLLIFNVIFEFCYAFTTPYGAWMAEQFKVEDRPKASQILNTFNYIGNGGVIIFSFTALANFKADVVADPNVVPPVFMWSVISFAVILVALFYIGVFLMPTEPRPKKIPKMKENLMKILRNRDYLMVVLMQGFASLAWIMVVNMMLKYVGDVLYITGIQYMMIGAILLIGIFIFLYIWRLIIKKTGKTQAIKTLFIVGAIILFFSIMGMFSWVPRLIFGIIFLLGIAATLGGWFLFPGFMYADYTEDEEKRSDEMNAGIFNGFPSILLNIFQGIGIFFLGLIGSLPNITVGTIPPFSIGEVLWGPICTIILIGVFFFTKYYVKLDFAWEKKKSRENEVETQQ